MDHILRLYVLVVISIMVSPRRQALYLAVLLPIVSPIRAKQQREYRSALPPRTQAESRRTMMPTTPAAPSSGNMNGETTTTTGGRWLSSNTLSDLVRFDFAGSVETHVLGPASNHATVAQDDDTVRQPPLFEIGRSNKNQQQQLRLLTSNLLIPSLYIGADYDFSQQQKRQRRWHGISCVFTRLRFRPTSALTVDVSRDQSIIVDLPSSTAVQCSWRGLRSTFRTTSSHSKSILVSVPVLPARLQWECCLSSNRDLADSAGVQQQQPIDQRSGWLVDAMGQIQGAQSFRLSEHVNARCTLRRRIRWISTDEGVAESTHFGLAMQCRHGNQSNTVAIISAQLEQLPETARLRIRHNVAIGTLLHRR
jgi:hypothetical protein